MIELMNFISFPKTSPASVVVVVVLYLFSPISTFPHEKIHIFLGLGKMKSH